MSERISQRERAKSFGFFLYRDSKGEVSGRGGVFWGLLLPSIGKWPKRLHHEREKETWETGVSLSLSRLAVDGGEEAAGTRARALLNWLEACVCVYGPLIYEKFV